jgi:hydrogenase maturation protease
MIEDMTQSKSSSILIVGIGNPYRGDDAAGPIALRRLGERAIEGVAFREESGEGAALMESWKGYNRTILLDAVSSEAPPGTIHRFDAGTGPLPRQPFRHSTHAFGLVEAVELARAMGRLPERLIVYGIEGKDFKAGEKLSPEVERSIESLVDRVVEEIGNGVGRPHA